MKPPKFTKTIRKCDVCIGLKAENSGGGIFMKDDEKGIYQDFSKPLTERQLLNILSQAYAWGYEAAVSDSEEAVRRVLYERKTAHAPRPCISETRNYSAD